MSDEHFMARWSRRKREAVADRPASDKPGDAVTKTEVAAREDLPAPASDASEKAATQSAPAAFDPASLPPLESITKATDVRGFMAPGVPAALRREALRRAWSTDPAIRDFVGLQEYDWDFNTPGAMFGFGALGSEHDVPKMVSKIFGESSDEGAERPEEATAVSDQAARPTGESSSDPDRGDDASAPPLSHHAVSADPASGTDESPAATVAGQQPEEIVHRNKVIALQYDEFVAAGGQKTRHSHGGALPKVTLKRDPSP